ncbi:FMN-linked oxidoreductase [Aspergillus affinis]|uniref:FMN-linked oxidoreductase n=1 Tax=Aspergillus affinis TaxID=1070780 RepID=UPI0022FE0467|nr:FMN-linked oxidoreductase [Aspergillus affinis]KAI9036401.1 FMN-linked oxidoreductase [Aspergillus affinis]
MPSPLNEPVKLPCGLVFPNRLVKAAMAEMLADRSTNLPTRDILEVYHQWGQGGWGGILTEPGNVQVDISHLGTPFDPSLPADPYTSKHNSADLVERYSRLAQAVQEHTSAPCIVQLCHPGRQSFRGAGQRGLCAPTIAPSAIPMRIGDGYLEQLISWVTFPAPREMSRGDIEAVTARFVDAARVMADAGFGGVELHGAHGYLIDQFLNPKVCPSSLHHLGPSSLSSTYRSTTNKSIKTNHRTDAYGGSAINHAKFVLDIIAQIRAVVPSSFCVGIKLNSADHDHDDEAAFEDTMTQIGLLVDAGIDFLEISGGSYQDPRMMGLSTNNNNNTESSPSPSPAQQQSTRTQNREAFFLAFSHETRKRYPSLILLLTGGFRTRAGAEAALSQNACDLIGIGRPAAVAPHFPNLMLDEEKGADEAGLRLGKVKDEGPWVGRVVSVVLGKLVRGVGAGIESAYYSGQIARMARGLKTVVPGL